MIKVVVQVFVKKVVVQVGSSLCKVWHLTTWIRIKADDICHQYRPICHRLTPIPTATLGIELSEYHIIGIALMSSA
jgi:hypothetical protein